MCVIVESKQGEIYEGKGELRRRWPVFVSVPASPEDVNDPAADETCLCWVDIPATAARYGERVGYTRSLDFRILTRRPRISRRQRLRLATRRSPGDA